MNRKQFLQRLLDKNQYKHQYVNLNLNQDYEYDQPPGIVKRMQIMQLGCARIGAPIQKKNQQPIIYNRLQDKKSQPINTTANSNQIHFHSNSNSNVNNKRVFVLQRVKNQKKRRQTDKSQKQQPSFTTLNSPQLKLKSDIVKQINNCITRQRFSMENINISPKSPALEYPKESQHVKTCSQSNRWGTFKKKYNMNHIDPLRASEMLPPTDLEYSMATKQIDNKTDRSQSKSMYMKAQTQNANNAASSSSSPTKKELSIIPRKLSNSAFQNRIVSDRKNGKQEKANKMIQRRELHKTYTKQFAAPPKLTAKSFVIIEKCGDKSPVSLQTKKSLADSTKTNHRVYLSFNGKSSVQVASLTKIMTCIVAIELCERYSLKPEQQLIKIGKYESNIGGTSAKIKQGDIYTLYDLLFGLMLPSGNDASLAIAVWGGKIIIGNGDKNASSINLDLLNTQKNKAIKKPARKSQYFNRFILQMNKKAKQLQMTKTNYANSHGLINSMNKSCAHDIAMLSIYAMENSTFRKIVGTKRYQTVIDHQQKILKKVSETTISTVTRNFSSIDKQKKSYSYSPNKRTLFKKQIRQKSYQSDDQDKNENISGQEDLSAEDEQQQVDQQPSIENTEFQYQIITTKRQIYWENTHKLLHKSNSKYIGIKTGVTTVAGPCLSSCVRSECGREFYIVVLNCKKMLLRFKQTELLKKWVFKQENIETSKGRKQKSRAGSIKTYSCVDSQIDQDQLEEEEPYQD